MREREGKVDLERSFTPKKRKESWAKEGKKFGICGKGTQSDEWGREREGKTVSGRSFTPKKWVHRETNATNQDKFCIQKGRNK